MCINRCRNEYINHGHPNINHDYTTVIMYTIRYINDNSEHPSPGSVRLKESKGKEEEEQMSYIKGTAYAMIVL
jgi:hypothetical protein